MKAMFGAVIRDWRHAWKRLFVTDVLYKILAVVLLTPLVSLLFGIIFALSGNTVLADQDILYFFLAPAGWLCLIVVGAMLLAIKALEMAALLAILAARPPAFVRPVGALRYASVNALPVLQVTARIIGIVLLTVLPFLLIAGVVYYGLLSDHDINYYLQERPPVFQIALGIGGLIVVVLVVVLLRYCTNWFFALPIVLFEDVPVNRALRESKSRSVGQRRKLLLAIVVWLTTISLLSGLVTGLIIGTGSFLIPQLAGNLTALALGTGVILLLWWLVNLIINLLGTTTFAAMLFRLYQQSSGSADVDPARLRFASIGQDSPWIRLTRARLAGVAVLGLVVAIVAGLVFANSVQLDDKTEIVAHRGASAVAPENTMAAVRQAIADGADWVEIDVQETADDQVVVFHDSDFMKLAGNPLKIWDATLPDLARIDIGSWFDPKFGDQRVPTLAQVLEECRGRAGVMIELKYYGHDRQLEKRVVDIVEACRMTDEIVIMSLKREAVEKMKALRPNWQVGLLMSVAAGDLRNINADFLAVNASFVDRSFVRANHSIGKQVSVWTVNDPVNMSRMIGKGVDGLITDKPALARTVLQQRADMSAPERLLVELAGVFGIEQEIAGQ